MFKGAWVELILVVDHRHGVLIVVISLEARHADHSSSFSSILPKLGVSGFFYSLNAPSWGRFSILSFARQNLTHYLDLLNFLIWLKRLADFPPGNQNRDRVYFPFSGFFAERFRSQNESILVL